MWNFWAASSVSPKIALDAIAAGDPVTVIYTKGAGLRAFQASA
jgi:hypothetical protein